MKTTLYVVGQTVGWFACVVGAAHGRDWLGLLVVAVLLVLHLCMHGKRPAGRIVMLAAVSLVFGFAFDSLLILAGVYEPVRWVIPAPWATIWLLALWVNFALIVDVPLKWLQHHLVIAAVCGGIFGPLAYLAGRRLGAIRIAEPTMFHVAVLSIAWALGLAALMFIARRLPPFELQRNAPNES